MLHPACGSAAGSSKQDSLGAVPGPRCGSGWSWQRGRCLDHVWAGVAWARPFGRRVCGAYASLCCCMTLSLGHPRMRHLLVLVLGPNCCFLHRPDWLVLGLTGCGVCACACVRVCACLLTGRLLGFVAQVPRALAATDVLSVICSLAYNPFPSMLMAAVPTSNLSGVRPFCVGGWVGGYLHAIACSRPGMCCRQVRCRVAVSASARLGKRPTMTKY